MEDRFKIEFTLTTTRERDGHITSRDTHEEGDCSFATVLDTQGDGLEMLKARLAKTKAKGG